MDGNLGNILYANDKLLYLNSKPYIPGAFRVLHPRRVCPFIIFTSNYSLNEQEKFP